MQIAMGFLRAARASEHAKGPVRERCSLRPLYGAHGCARLMAAHEEVLHAQPAAV